MGFIFIFRWRDRKKETIDALRILKSYAPLDPRYISSLTRKDLSMRNLVGVSAGGMGEFPKEEQIKTTVY